MTFSHEYAIIYSMTPDRSSRTGYDLGIHSKRGAGFVNDRFSTPEQQDRARTARAGLVMLYTANLTDFVRRLEFAKRLRTAVQVDVAVIAQSVTPENIRDHYTDFTGPMVEAETGLLHLIANPVQKTNILQQSLGEVVAVHARSTSEEEKRAYENRITHIEGILHQFEK